MRRVAVYLEDATWERLSARAAESEESLSKAAARLVKAGLVGGTPPVVVRASEEALEGVRFVPAGAEIAAGPIADAVASLGTPPSRPEPSRNDEEDGFVDTFRAEPFQEDA